MKPLKRSSVDECDHNECDHVCELKHTKGPWEIRQRDIEGFHQAFVILNQKENEDNAQLIAAAPEMLKALELICSDDRLMNAMKLEQVRAILDSIKKAKVG